MAPAPNKWRPPHKKRKKKKKIKVGYLCWGGVGWVVEEEVPSKKEEENKKVGDGGMVGGL